ncbi:MAG: pyrophosphatase [Anaerolineae bacterium]
MNIPDLAKQVETVSSLYAERNGIDRTDDWFVLKINEEIGELVQAYLNMQGQGRDRGEGAESGKTRFENELADVLGHLLLLANRFDVDMDAAVQRKWLKWLPEA